MKPFALRAAVFLCILEVLGHALAGGQRSWYTDAARHIEEHPARFIFIGSSRVAQAILPSAFGQAAGFQPSAALNMGRGHSSMAQHVLGLQLLAEASTRRLAGATVFVEAPEGLPDLDTWAGHWFKAEDPGLLNVTMRPRDLPAFWSESSASLADKISISLSEVSGLAALRGSWSHYARAGWRMLRGDAGQDGDGEPLLTEAGGVRTGEAAYVVARRLAERTAQQALRDDRELTRPEIDASILMSLRAFLQRERAALVVYEMPLGNPLKRAYSTPARRRGRALVASALERAGTPVLQTGFVASDADFPDYWHLRRSRAADFSRALARAYLGRQAAQAKGNGAPETPVWREVPTRPPSAPRVP